MEEIEKLDESRVTKTRVEEARSLFPLMKGLEG